MRVARTFAFLDLCGFTEFASTKGDDEATRVLAGFRSSLREIASRRGVRVDKWLGDGAMIVGVEPEPCVATVLEVEHRIDDGSSDLPLRVGMTTGLVILFEGDDYIGTTVNLASRLCDAAKPRQIVAVPALRNYLPAWASVHDLGPAPIAGFHDPVDMVQVSRRPPGREQFTDPVCGMVLPLDGAMAHTMGRPFCSESCAASWTDRALRTPG